MKTKPAGERTGVGQTVATVAKTVGTTVAMTVGTTVAMTVAITIAVGVAATGCSSSKAQNGDGGLVTGACLSDKDCRDRGLLCDTARAACVQCLTKLDCGPRSDCVSNACVAVTTCASSLDCKTDEVCDVVRGRCVGCLADTDCGATGRCMSNVCRAPCQSDKDCVSMQQLCDFATGICVACVRNADCVTGQYCDANACRTAVCASGATSCVSNMLLACAPNGDAWQPQMVCPVECRTTVTGGMCVDGMDAAGDVPPNTDADGGSAVDEGTGSDASSSPDASTGPDVFVAPGPCGDFVDTMEDGDGYICRGNGRIGQWYTVGSYVSPSALTHPTPPATISPAREASTYAARVTAPSGLGSDAILGVDLQYDGATIYGFFDGSAYQGVSFWTRGTGVTALDVYVSCTATTSTQYGGSCPSGNLCIANHGRASLSSTWTQQFVPFSALAGGYTTFDPTRLTHLQFRPATSPIGALDIWVDDVAFYR